MNILANPIESTFLYKTVFLSLEIVENTEIPHVIELGSPVRARKWLFPELLAAYPWVGIRIIPTNLGEVLHLRAWFWVSRPVRNAYRPRSCLRQRKKSLVSVLDKFTSCLTKDGIVQINELSLKATRLSPLKDRGLEGERSGFCPVSHLSGSPSSSCPALAAAPHTLPLGDHVYGTKEFLICSFPEYKKNKVPSSADGTVSLFPKTEKERS